MALGGSKKKQKAPGSFDVPDFEDDSSGEFFELDTYDTYSDDPGLPVLDEEVYIKPGRGDGLATRGFTKGKIV